jgi:hypothetical protein
MTSDDYKRLADWMREPDRDEEFSLADIVEWVNRRPIDAVESLRAASVKAGEVVAWRFNHADGRHSYYTEPPSPGLLKHCTPLYAAQPAPTASVGLREALEQALERMKMAVDWWNKGGHSLPQMSAAIEMAESALAAANQSDGGEESGVTLPPKDFARVCSAVHAAKDVLRGYAKIEYDTDNNPQPNFAFEVEQQCKEALYTLDECNAGFPPSRREPSDTPPAPQPLQAVSVDEIKDFLAGFHRNACYPEAMSGELDEAARALLAKFKVVR